MKKFLMAAVVLLGSISLANAERFSIGVTATGALFTADDASEIFSGDHAGNRTSDKVTKKTSDEGEDAEALVGMASIFVELNANDRISLGVNYVPSSLESETAENVRLDKTTTDTRTSKTNSIKVAFEDLTEYYISLNLGEHFYVKGGVSTVDVETKENLATGSAYGNTDLDGTITAVGFNNELDNGLFIRMEAKYMDFDGTTLTSSNTDNKVQLKSLEGASGSLSVGKTF